MNKYYFEGDGDKYINFVICSHGDADHASGLSVLFDNFTIGALYVNRPWKYASELFEHVNDERITVKSLEDRLKKKYRFIAELEEKAEKHKIPIFEAFEGALINERITILSPSKEFYLELIVESDKTPLEEASSLESNDGFLSKVILKASNLVKYIVESWTKESLREDVSTSADNEMSVVVHGDMVNGRFLFTGDAGIRALSNALDFAESISIAMQDVTFHQIPHHGSKKNVSPTVLNRLVGEVVNEDAEAKKTAFISIGKGSEKPIKMVKNAYIRRGCKVCVVSGSTVRHKQGTPDREGWKSVVPASFNNEVEDWD